MLFYGTVQDSVRCVLGCDLVLTFPPKVGTNLQNVLVNTQSNLYTHQLWTEMSGWITDAQTDLVTYHGAN